MLNGKQRAYLRSMANRIETILHVGKDGISENLVSQLNGALSARELVKCRVLETSPLSAREACEELCVQVRGEPVQVIGSRFVIYRENRENRTIELPGTRPIKKAAVRKAPAKKTYAQKSEDRKAPVKKTYFKKTETKRGPANKTYVKRAAGK